MRIHCLGVVLVPLTLGLSTVRAQSPGPAVDPTPLARPKALVTLPGLATPLFQRLQKVLTKSGFRLTESDPDGLVLDTQRPDSTSPDDYDRVILWLQCHPTNAKRYDVFLLYGRYEKQMGNHVGVSRVVVDHHFVDQRIGALQGWIIALGDSLRGTQ